MPLSLALAYVFSHSSFHPLQHTAQPWFVLLILLLILLLLIVKIDQVIDALDLLLLAQVAHVGIGETI